MSTGRAFPFLILLIIPAVFLPPVQRAADEARLFLHGVLKPFLATSEFVSGNLKSGTANLAEFLTLYRDHQQLQADYEKLRQEVETLRELKKENERLNELLAVKKNFSRRSRSAHIINRSISYWFRRVVIDVGEDDGIKAHTILVNDLGVVGRIVKLGRTVSECMLLTDPESHVAATLQTSRAVGMISGQGVHDRLRMNLIPRDSEIKVGDAVVTSGLGSVYPKGLLLGHVAAMGVEEDGMHLFAEVKPAVNFNTLEEVLCIEALQ